MTLVTFLGMVGIRREGDTYVADASSPKAEYLFNPALVHALGLEKAPYIYENMLPLLLETFPVHRVVAVGTPQSIVGQSALLKACYPEAESRVEYLALDDAHDYRAIFRRLGDVLENDEELIVDISHSFRHLPALMMVDMIIANIKHPGRVHHILFAKELKKGKRYRIVDLREYLTLANVSYALASFTKNYTLATTVRTVDEIYQALLNDLTNFGEHILANSFEAILRAEGDNPPVAQKILDIIGVVKTHEHFKDLAHPIEPYLEEIADHMREILDQAKRPMDERLFFFARQMFDKGYLLNALTLLDEAVASYCVEAFRRIPETEEYVKRFEDAIRTHKKSKLVSQYTLFNTAKNVVKLQERYILKRDNRDKNNVVYDYGEALKNYMLHHRDRHVKKLGKFIDKCDNLRNNLAHANSAERLEDARRKIKELLMRYEEVCYGNDPLHRFH